LSPEELSPEELAGVLFNRWTRVAAVLEAGVHVWSFDADVVFLSPTFPTLKLETPPAGIEPATSSSPPLPSSSSSRECDVAYQRQDGLDDKAEEEGKPWVRANAGQMRLRATPAVASLLRTLACGAHASVATEEVGGASVVGSAGGNTKSIVECSRGGAGGAAAWEAGAGRRQRLDSDLLDVLLRQAAAGAAAVAGAGSSEVPASEAVVASCPLPQDFASSCWGQPDSAFTFHANCVKVNAGEEQEGGEEGEGEGQNKVVGLGRHPPDTLHAKVEMLHTAGLYNNESS
jgi:hypothetical protein